MSTYEVYYGGPRQQNSNYAMLPSAAFSTSQAYNPAVMQQPVMFGTARKLDFSGFDEALTQFLVDHPVVSGDILGASVIPANSLFLGVWWQVATPLTGGAFSIKLRQANVTLLSGQSTGTATSGFQLKLTGIAWLPTYLTVPDIIDVVYGTVPAGGLTGLVMSVAPLYACFNADTR